MIQQPSSVMSFDRVQTKSMSGAFPLPRPVNTANAKLLKSAPDISPELVHLDLDKLVCFEGVERQFERWGIVFKNAIAIRPSNPAFPTRQGQTVLMGAPQSGLLDATFKRPACFFSAFLTSSRRAVITAFDAANTLVAKAETPGANLAGGETPYAPNWYLTLQASNIHHIRVRSVGGQFTLDGLTVGF